MNRRTPAFLIALLLSVGLWPRWTAAAQALVEPPKAPAGFFQIVSPAMNIECNVSKEFTEKVARMVMSAEQRFYQLFKLTPDLVNGVAKEKFDKKGNIPGDVLKQFGFRPYIGVRVYKDMESFSDEWFDETGVKDKQQRLRQGLPGAWFSIHSDYDKSHLVREIRTFVSNRDDDELERTLLHEMGHLFMQTYLLEFGGAPPPGQESQKRGTPAWLGEGVAQLFEILWSNAKTAAKARMRQEAMIYEAVQLGDSYPFDEFTNVTNAHNLAAVAGDPLKSTLNYAQSFSVMDYMVNVDGNRFFNFLENLRALNFERNLRTRDRNHIPELYSFQNDAFKRAFNCDLTAVEGYWKKHLKTTMEALLKKQPELYYHIGEYYLRRGKDKANDLAKAEEKFKLAMTEAPAKGEGYLGMGRMALRKNEHDAAVKFLAKAAELLPKDDEVWYYLGCAQVGVGELAEATQSFGKSLKIFARSHRALAGLAMAQFHSAEYVKAAESYEQAYQVSHNPFYLMEKGRAAFFGKEYRMAQNGFSVFCDIFPNDAQGQLWYGLAAWRLNDREFALQKLKQAVTLNPNDPTIKEALRLAAKGETLHFAMESAPPPAQAATASSPAGKTAPEAKKKPVFVQVQDE
jgi:tetratricopeptide (TPR) repeat protein